MRIRTKIIGFFPKRWLAFVVEWESSEGIKSSKDFWVEFSQFSEKGIQGVVFGTPFGSILYFTSLQWSKI